MRRQLQARKEIRFIFLSFVLIAILFIAFKISNYYEMKPIHSLVSEIYEHPFTVSNAARKVQLEIYKIHRDMKDIVLSRSQDTLASLIAGVDAYEQRVYETLTLIKEKILGEKGLELQQETFELFKDWKPIRDEVIKLVMDTKIDEAIKITQHRGADHVLKMDAAADKLYKYASTKAEGFKNSAMHKTYQLENTSRIFYLLLMLVFILIVYYTINRISTYMYRSEHLNSVLSMVRDINQLIGVEKDLEHLIGECVKIITSRSFYSSACIILLDDDAKIEYIAGTDKENINIFKEKVNSGWMPQCIQKAKSEYALYSLVNDTTSYCDACPLGTLQEHQSGLEIALKYEDKIFGYLMLAIDRKDLNDIVKLKLLEKTASDIGNALYSIQIAQKLFISEQRYRTIFQGNRTIELIIDPKNGVIVDANNKASEYYGYSIDELLNMKISDINILSPEDINVEMQRAEGEQNDIFFCKHKLANGEIRDVEVYSGPIELDDNTLLYSIVFDVTDRMKLEEEKKHIQDRLNLIIESSTDGIWDWDLLTNQVYFSPRWKELLGYKDEELENRLETWDSNLHPDDREQAYRNVKASQTKESKFFKSIHRLKHKDGHWVWIEARGQTLFDEQGKAIRMMGSHTDISEHREMSEALNLSKQRYELAEKIGKVGSWEYSVDTEEFWASNESKVIYGLPPESESYSIKIVEGCIVERERVHQALVDLLEKGTEYNLEFEIHPLDGSDPKIISSIAKVELDKSKKPFKVTGVIQDITEKKRNQILLEEKKNEFETMIKEAPSPIMIYNEDGKVIMVNNIWKQLTGYEFEDIDTIEKWTSLAYGEKKLTVKEDMDRFYEQNKKIDEGQYDVITKDGQIITWQFSSAPLGFIEGKRTIISSAMDITELKNKDEMLIEQSRYAAMGEMIGMIAHQWRQPITAITMDANNMLLDIALECFSSSEAEKYAKSITKQTQHLSETIDDFRNFFKPDKVISEVNIRELLDGTLSIVSDSLKNNNIELTISFETDKKVNAYPRELMQVFVNIINNSKDALMLNNKDNASISIKVYEDKKYVNTKICDNGGGIDVEILPKIFDPYFSTKDEKTGTGLGLYMSKMIIENHLHGTIDASNSNGGACFTIRLLKEEIEHEAKQKQP